MTTVEEIQEDIVTLPGEQFEEIVNWINKKDMERWDIQIEKDAKSGKLDFLKEQADRAMRDGTYKEL